jgi:ankyrin repeat protein
MSKEDEGDGFNWEAYVSKNYENGKSLNLKRCREKNQAYQLRQKLWVSLMGMKEIESQFEKLKSDSLSCSSGIRKGLSCKYNIKYEECKNLILKYSDKPGPVGNFPIHDCILLGQIELAREVIMESPGLANCTYADDLKPWKSIIDGQGIDTGLYTGETVLHMAICLGEAELVAFLLEKKRCVDLNAEATGMFFKPPFIRKKNIPRDRFARHTNEDSRCYYGAFPLSFAASVGREDICQQIFDAFLAGHKGPQQANAALRRQDDCGNTALHMAVIHRRTRAIDWLLERETELMEAKRLQRGSEAAGEPREERLLDLLNWDGLTALTLAARLGFVDVFHHVLRHLSGTAWQFGEVPRGWEGSSDRAQTESFLPLAVLARSRPLPARPCGSTGTGGGGAGRGV